MKTPIQELIEQLKELQDTQDPYGLHDAIEFAESFHYMNLELAIKIAYGKVAAESPNQTIEAWQLLHNAGKSVSLCQILYNQKKFQV